MKQSLSAAAELAPVWRKSGQAEAGQAEALSGKAGGKNAPPPLLPQEL